MNSFPYRYVNVVGAPGSGSTTLGRSLAKHLGFAFADADSFYWKPTDPPFKEKYDADVRLHMLLGELNASSTIVVSGSVCGWGDELENSFDLVIFLSLPTDLRIQRIEAREISMFERADPAFLAWAAQYEQGQLPGRSRARHELWLRNRHCHVMRFEDDEAVDTRIRQIVRLANVER